MSTSATAQEYHQAAREKFDAFKTRYGEGDAYWRLGHAFDTVIDYFDIIDSSSAPTMQHIVVEQYRDSLGNLKGYDNAWFDDFGWWTIAARRATQRAYFAPAFFQDVQDQCWSRFTANAPKVWERRGLHPDRFVDFRPAFEGGVWNEYWAGTSGEYKGPKDGDPRGCDPPGFLHGIQNTVSNTLYLVAAQRVGDQAAADRVFEFLRQWFLPSEHGSLWWQEEGSEAALVRERAPHFHGMSTPAPGYQPDWAWTGDQGLLLGALADRLRMEPTDRDHLSLSAKRLLAGVRTRLVASNHALQSYTSTGSIPDDDAPDYDTGTAVFWRYALHAYRTAPELRAVIDTPEYRDFVRASANAATRGKSNNERSLTELTNDLAVLVAAAEMLP